MKSYFSNSEEKLWFSTSKKAYRGNMPAYYNSSQFKWAVEIEKNIAEIQQELLRFIEKKEHTFQPYFNNSLSEKEHSWKTFIFNFWGTEINVLSDLPLLKSIVSKYPEFISIGLSQLTRNSAIKPHRGDSNAYVRCHLPIIIPAGLPNCGLEVNNEKRPWNMDKLTIFCDAYVHSAFNYTREDRIVLIFDVLLDSFSDRREEIQETVKIILWAQGQKRLKNIPFSIVKIASKIFN